MLNTITLNVICIEIDSFEPVYPLPRGQTYTATKLYTVHQTSRYTNCGVYQFDLKLQTTAPAPVLSPLLSSFSPSPKSSSGERASCATYPNLT
jgi:hypothetical protein